jgi:hypothetical protein
VQRHLTLEVTPTLDDDVEDETFLGQFELRRHRRTGSDDIEYDEAMDGDG